MNYYKKEMIRRPTKYKPQFLIMRVNRPKNLCQIAIKITKCLLSISVCMSLQTGSKEQSRRPHFEKRAIACSLCPGLVSLLTLGSNGID